MHVHPGPFHQHKHDKRADEDHQRDYVFNTAGRSVVAAFPPRPSDLTVALDRPSPRGVHEGHRRAHRPLHVAAVDVFHVLDVVGIRREPEPDPAFISPFAALQQRRHQRAVEAPPGQPVRRRVGVHAVPLGERVLPIRTARDLGASPDLLDRGPGEPVEARGQRDVKKVRQVIRQRHREETRPGADDVRGRAHRRAVLRLQRVELRSNLLDARVKVAAAD